MLKFNTYLSLACLLGAQIDHAANKLFHGLRVLDSEKLANLHCQG